MKIRTALAAAILLAAPALADDAVRRIQVGLEEGGDARRAALETIADGEIVYLDILFRDPGEVCGADWGPAASGPDGYVALPQDGDNHLLVQVAPGAPDAFPFNAVTCEYAPTLDQMTAVRLRGFYAPLSMAIPTARLMTLRPIRLDPMLESAIVRAAD